MKLKHIYITKEGEPMANPEMPLPLHFKEEFGYTQDDIEDYSDAMKKYHSGLLPFEDRENVFSRLPNDDWGRSPHDPKWNPDTLIPVDLEVEVVEVCQIACQSPCDSYNDTGHCKNPKIFLRIKP